MYIKQVKCYIKPSFDGIFTR